MSKHNVSNANELYWGKGRYAALLGRNGRIGGRMDPITKVSLGTPIVADPNALIVAATSTELPNTETVTYTFPDSGGSTPIDGANQTGILDYPRNITAAVTHGSSIVAMTILVSGKDEYDEDMSELLTVTATGTSKTVNGLKAFKKVLTIAVTAAADAEANTLNMGFGDVLGLPYQLEHESDVLAFYADTTEEKLASVFVPAVTVVATTTTGDVRGTVNPDTTLDGSVEFWCWMKIKDVDTKRNLVGVTQA